MFENLWVEKWRPKNLNDLILTQDVRNYFEDVRKKQEIPHLLFFGFQGSGKSSLAKIVVNEILDCQYLYINMSSESGIDTIRNKVNNFVQTKSIDGKLKVILGDECDFLSPFAQGALRNVIEEFSSNSRFILTANYINRLIGPIVSRCLKFELVPPMNGCIERCIHIIKSENIKVENGQREQLSNLIKTKYPDLRSIINDIQKYSINNVLNIPKNLNIISSFSRELFDKLTSKENIFKIRKYVIENVLLYNNDHQLLLKELFETIYESNERLLSDDQKKKVLLILAEGIYKHQTVLDKEINCFAALIEISEVLNEKKN